MARKKSLAGLGARYGIKLRKQYTKIHHLLKQVRACPKCGSKSFARVAVGVWACKKCEFKMAGTAYDVKIWCIH